MPDYTKAVIYKIETGGELYVGSTCNFTQRKHAHNKCVKFQGRHCISKLYNTIRENGEWKMTPIKEFPCESKLQLTIEEEKWRIELGATLNTKCCGTGIETQDKKQYKKQYQEQNKEQISKRNEHYYQENKQNRLEYQKE